MSYEHIMETRPDLQSGFNLLVCYFALGDKENMKRCLKKLLEISETDSGVPISEEEEDKEDKDDDVDTDEGDEELRKAEREARHNAKALILMGTKLIVPKLFEHHEGGVMAGFNYVIDELKASEHYMDLASDMIISKAVYFLKHNNAKEAKQTLLDVCKGAKETLEDGSAKECKEDPSILSRAYTNLCFIYFLEGDIIPSTTRADESQPCADLYGTLAIKKDRYNAKALVNKGNCEMYKALQEEKNGRLDSARLFYHNAKELYMEGIGVEADCVEAIFNLGLCSRYMAYLDYEFNKENYQKTMKISLQAFEKLNSILSDAPECTWNIAFICDQLSEMDTKYFKRAKDTYKRLSAQVKTDAGVLARYGALLARDDESDAVSNQQDSYKYFPCDMDVISWLGAYFVRSEMYEKAIEYFHRASQIQPKEVKWKLMVASCHRRINDLERALATYMEIDKKHPDNIECLNYLQKLCQDLGRHEDYEKYTKALSKAQAQQMKEEAAEAGGSFAQQSHYGGGGGNMGGGVRDSYGGYGEFNAMSSNKDDNMRNGMVMGGGGRGEGGGRWSGGGGGGGMNSEAARVVAEREAAAGGKRSLKAKGADDDDWGNDELGDDLLPM
jgi:intraflagellar transport protein 88